MKSKKKTLALIILMAVVAVLLLFWPSTSTPNISMPVSPERITKPGRYTMGDGRYVEIAMGENGFEYWEGREEIPDPGSSLPQLVSYSASEIQSVQLDAGWSLEFTPPDQFEIRSGTGEVFRRTFGEIDFAHVSQTPTGQVTRIRKEDRKPNKAEMATPRKPSD